VVLASVVQMREHIPDYTEPGELLVIGANHRSRR
jgi:hypothetical protein